MNDASSRPVQLAATVPVGYHVACRVHNRGLLNIVRQRESTFDRCDSLFEVVEQLYDFWSLEVGMRSRSPTMAARECDTYQLTLCWRLDTLSIASFRFEVNHCRRCCDIVAVDHECLTSYPCHLAFFPMGTFAKRAPMSSNSLMTVKLLDDHKVQACQAR